MTEKGCEQVSDGWAGEEERLGAEGQGWRLAPGAGLRAEVVGQGVMRGFVEEDGWHCCVTGPCEG